MYEKEMEKKLRGYIEKTKEVAETEGYILPVWKQWIFGAIDFASYAGLINREVYKELTEEFRKMTEGEK